VVNGVETKRENAVLVPFMFDIHKNQPSTSIIKSRSIDAEFSHNFQQHQKIGTRSVSNKYFQLVWALVYLNLFEILYFVFSLNYMHFSFEINLLFQIVSNILC